MAMPGMLGRMTGKARADDSEIRAALQKWKDATRFFESVSDPELMDYAIYDMEAARRRYMFLLRQKGRGK